MTSIRVPRTGLRFADLVREALVGIAIRPGRVVFTALGVAVGVALLVVTVGLNETGTAAVRGTFVAREQRSIVVELPDDRPEITFPPDTDRKLRSLNGVAEAGVMASLGGRGVEVEILPGLSLGHRPVVAATPGALRMGGAVVRGATPNGFHEERSSRVAVVPADLQVTFPPGSSIRLDGVSFTVIGVSASADDPLLASSIVVPYSTARALWAGIDRGEARLDVEPAAIGQLRREIGLALFPQAPDWITVLTPPRALSLQREVEGTLGTLGLILAGIAVVIGAMSIGSAVMVGVLERRHEIGVRRVLGATRLHISVQFLTESMLIGTFGGIAGAIVGVIAVVGLSVIRDWVPIVPPWTVVVGPVVGTAVGLLAGIVPALRAARVEPVETLRV